MDRERNARQRLPSVSRILDFAKSNGGAVKIGLFLFLGVTLILFGALGGRGESSQSDTALGEEETLERICSSVVGVGECRVIIGYTPATRTAERRVESVCVVCRGASSAKVRERLTELLSSLYGIGSNRICIAQMG